MGQSLRRSTHRCQAEGWCSSVSYKSPLNSSTVRPACRMMARSVPLSNAEWSGTTTRTGGLTRFRIIWLPRWRSTKKPCLRRAAKQALPETEGSLLRRQQLRPETDPRAPAGCQSAATRYTARSLPLYCLALPLWFCPEIRNPAGWGILSPKSHPRLGRPILGGAGALVDFSAVPVYTSPFLITPFQTVHAVFRHTAYR